MKFDSHGIITIGTGLKAFTHAQFIRINENGTASYAGKNNADSSFSKCVNIDFTPEGQQEQVKRSDQVDVMLQLIEELNTLINLLRTPEFQNVKYIYGTTNPVMREFSKRLGFKSISNFQDRVIITSSELKNSTEKLKNIYQILIKRKQQLMLRTNLN